MCFFDAMLQDFGWVYDQVSWLGRHDARSETLWRGGFRSAVSVVCEGVWCVVDLAADRNPPFHWG